MTSHLRSDWTEAEKMRAELAFLRVRHMHDDSSWVGRSSDALVTAAMQDGEHPPPSQWPSDESDLARCEETYRRAPAHWQVLMLPILERFRRHVAEGGLYCCGCDNSIGHWATTHDLCPSCFAAAGEPAGGPMAVRIGGHS